MMRGVVRSLFVVGLLGGMAFAGDPMPPEQAADPKPADSKFETVKRDMPTDVAPAAASKHAKKSKHKKSHQARKAAKHHHKHKHHKAKAK